MPPPQDYVLVLDEHQQWVRQSDLPLAATRCPVFVASSAEQAVEKARQTAPCLVILVGNDHSWFKAQVNALRRSTRALPMTIVALTESHQPSWEHHEDTPELDGFLVKPLTDDVLNSLVQSAIAKQSYRPIPLAAVPLAHFPTLSEFQE